jgi:RNA polymerase sigma factor (sigma-70 family)
MRIGGFMKRVKMTEITIEIDRTKIVRCGSSSALANCAQCSEKSPLVTPEEAIHLARTSSLSIYREVEAGRVHFIETTQGLLLVCLNSIIQREIEQSPGAPETSYRAAPPSPRQADINEDETVSIDEAVLHQKNSRAVSSPKTKKDWVLTPSALDKLLSHLDSDRDVAGRKYENMRRKLIKYFECRGCVFPEEQADETIDRVARRLDEGIQIWASEPAIFFYGVARNVLKEYFSAPERQLSSIEDLPPSLDQLVCHSGLLETQNDAMTLDEKLQLLELSLQSLLPQSRELVIRYYQGGKPGKIRGRKEMARSLGIPPNTLRLRIHRIREKLKRQIKDCF